MNTITPLLEQYNGLVHVIMNTDYSPQEYIATEQQLAQTLEKLNGKLSCEHLEGITRITQVVNTEAVMVPMAHAVSSIESDASFDYLLEHFLECFEDDRYESKTADACFEAMMKLDTERVKREGIDCHPYFL